MEKKKENDKGFHTYRGYEMLRKGKANLTPSMEDYLEMIYRTCKKHGYIRMSRLAKQLNVKIPSATKTVRSLTEMGFLIYEKYGIIQLTKKGAEIGDYLLKRHKIIEVFFSNIGVKNDILRQTEMVEHHLTSDTVKNIDTLNEFFKNHPEIRLQLSQFQKDCRQ